MPACYHPRAVDTEGRACLPSGAAGCRFPPSATEDGARQEGWHGPAAAADGAGRGAIIADDGTGLRLVYEPDRAFRFWVLWNGDGKGGFAALEPQTWVIDAPNSALPARQTGMAGLGPGESWRGACRLRLLRADPSH